MTLLLFACLLTMAMGQPWQMCDGKPGGVDSDGFYSPFQLGVHPGAVYDNEQCITKCFNKYSHVHAWGDKVTQVEWKLPPKVSRIPKHDYWCKKHGRPTDPTAPIPCTITANGLTGGDKSGFRYFCAPKNLPRIHEKCNAVRTDDNGDIDPLSRNCETECMPNDRKKLIMGTKMPSKEDRIKMCDDPNLNPHYDVFDKYSATYSCSYTETKPNTKAGHIKNMVKHYPVYPPLQHQGFRVICSRDHGSTPEELLQNKKQGTMKKIGTTLQKGARHATIAAVPFYDPDSKSGSGTGNSVTPSKEKTKPDLKDVQLDQGNNDQSITRYSQSSSNGGGQMLHHQYVKPGPNPLDPSHARREHFDDIYDEYESMTPYQSPTYDNMNQMAHYLLFTFITFCVFGGIWCLCALFGAIFVWSARKIHDMKQYDIRKTDETEHEMV